MFYPVNINLDNMNIIIIGGGKVAFRKCKNFIEFEKRVTVVAPELNESFGEIIDKVEIIRDKFKIEYLDGFNIAVVATDDKNINSEIADICKSKGIMVNVVDDRGFSDFTVSSYVRRGDLLIGISTGGKSPALSARIRRELEEKYDDNFVEYIEILGNIREKVIKKYNDKSERKAVLIKLANMSLEEIKKVKI